MWRYLAMMAHWGEHLPYSVRLPINNYTVDNATAFKVLEKSFPEKEWQYLVGQPVFIGLLAKERWSLKELDELIESANLLLKRRNDLDHPNAPRNSG